MLNCARVESGDSVETFELISRQVLDLVLKHIPDTRDPLTESYEYYVLLEIVSTKQDDNETRKNFENMLEKALESELILDAAFAQTEQHRQEFWSLLENATESQKL